MQQFELEPQTVMRRVKRRAARHESDAPHTRPTWAERMAQVGRFLVRRQGLPDFASADPAYLRRHTKQGYHDLPFRDVAAMLVVTQGKRWPTTEASGREAARLSQTNAPTPEPDTTQPSQHDHVPTTPESPTPIGATPAVPPPRAQALRLTPVTQ